MAYASAIEAGSSLRGCLMVTRVLLDTNILVYSRDEASPFFASTVKALKNIIINGAQPCIHRQVLREYVSVTTKPSPRGLGSNIGRALQDVEEFEAFYLVLPEPDGAWSSWKQLLREHGVTGLRIHDAYIVAVMMVYGISSILTFNIEVFADFPAIKPVTPEAWHKIFEE